MVETPWFGSGLPHPVAGEMETVVAQYGFQDESVGLGDGWEWVRENKGSWRILQNEGLAIHLLPGGIWNDEMQPAKNILAREWLSSAYDGGSSEHPKNPLAVEVRVRIRTQNWGEQAGVLLYNADDDWIKLVVECTVRASRQLIVQPCLFSDACMYYGCSLFSSIATWLISYNQRIRRRTGRKKL